MKVYGNRLAGELKKGLGSTYLISGDEPLLVQEACDAVRGAANAAGFTERELFHVEGSFNWGELDQSMDSMSLFAERKVVEVRMTTAKPGDTGAKTLVAMAERRSEDTLLLVVMPRVDASTQRTKWFKSFEANALFVQVWPIEARELPRWLEGRFKQAGLDATQDAVRALAARVEGNLLAAVQEIERLKLMAGDGGKVDVDLVTGAVADNARFDVFNLIDSALSGNGRRAQRMVQGLEAEGAETMFLLNMLIRELRTLERMAAAMEKGTSLNQVLRDERVWDKRKEPVTKCLNRLNAAELGQATVTAGRIDRMVKGVEQGDPWRELSRLVLALSGTLPAAPPPMVFLPD